MTPEEMRAELLRRQLAARQAAVKAAENPSRPKWTENIWGAGEADTTGERIGQTINDMGKSLGSGITIGATALMDAPGALLNAAGSLGAKGLEAVGAPNMAVGMRDAFAIGPMGTGATAGQAADLAMPRVRSFEPKTTPGEYTQTVGEFLPGSVLGGGNLVGSAIRYGVLPGLASEAAGQATEGTEYEPYARIAAALGTPLLTGRPTNNAAPILPRIDPEDAKMAETLMQNGIRPTVGQATGSDFLRRLEGTLDVLPNQADDVTAAAMKTTGSAATRATPEALKQASDEIVNVMDNAVAGVSFQPSAAMAQQADDVVKNYLRSTAQGSIVPDVRNVADEIMDAATNPNAAPLDLATLKDWRSRLGKLLRGSDPQAREAAWGLRSIIDDATEAQLTAAGRADDVAALGKAREQYRNWIAVADASTRAGAESGILSPTQLNQEVIRSQGRRNFAVGNTTPLGDLSRAAAGILRPAATVSAGGVRTVSPQIISGLMGAGVANAMMPGSPIIASLLGAGLGAAATSGGQALMRSTPVQSLMMDPMRRIAQTLLAAPGTAAGQSN